jgi:SAM-dependent methyltransferase
MIDRARAKSAGTRITWQQAKPYSRLSPNESFELIVCQFDVMFFPDKQASFREAARVLTPRGRYLFAVWDDWKRMSEAPLAVATNVVAAMLGCDPASLVNPAYHDETTLREGLCRGTVSTDQDRTRHTARRGGVRTGGCPGYCPRIANPDRNRDPASWPTGEGQRTPSNVRSKRNLATGRSRAGPVR